MGYHFRAMINGKLGLSAILNVGLDVIDFNFDPKFVK